MRLAHAYAGQTAVDPVDAEELIDGEIRAKIGLDQDEINQALEVARQESVEIGKGILA